MFIIGFDLFGNEFAEWCFKDVVEDLPLENVDHHKNQIFFDLVEVGQTTFDF